MTRETWKCPHTHCQQECGRRWNLSRHIRTRHSSIGNPVKNKSSVGGSPITKMPSNYTGLQLPDITQLTTSKYGAGNDMVDSIYKTFKKVRDIHDKITEIKDFYSNSTILPLPSIVPNAIFPFEITESEKATKSSVSEVNVANSAISSKFDAPVGFLTYICANCLTGPVDPVGLSDWNRLGAGAFQPNHVCEQQDLHRRLEAEKQQQFDFITKWNELRLLSIKYLSNLVHNWVGLHNDIYINAVERANLKPKIVDSLPINLGKIDKNHWAHRALNDKDKKTVIGNTELMDFLNLAKATFAPFRAEMEGTERYFYLHILQTRCSGNDKILLT